MAFSKGGSTTIRELLFSAKRHRIGRFFMIEPDLLLQGYQLGVFPMAMDDDSIGWFSPDPRAIIPLEKFHVPHALRRIARKEIFETKIDQRFAAVIRACAPPTQHCINREVIESYERLR